jgi:hypothetical protein
MQSVKQTYELALCGVITKENAIDNLWNHYMRARDDSNKILIANKIKHIEQGYW